MPTPQADIRQLHERLGRLSPPVDVHGSPSHGFVVAYRVPLEAGARLLPPGLSLREVGRTGLGMLCLCGGEFRGARVGKLAIPAPSHQDFHCRAIVDHRTAAGDVPAGYTLHYEASSRIVELCSGNLSGLRHPPSRFACETDGEHWAVSCTSKEPLSCMSFSTRPHLTSWTPPESTAFGSLRAASEFLLDLEGHLVHDYARDKTSYRAREMRACDAAFCPEFASEFPLIGYLDEAFELGLELDCALFLGAKRPARVAAQVRRTGVATDGDSAELPAGAG